MYTYIVIIFDVKADVFIKMMKMIYIVLLIVALFEIISGYHLPTSSIYEAVEKQVNLQNWEA